MSLQKAYYTWPWCDISKQPGCLMNGSPSIWTGNGLEACILMTFPWANLLAWESPTCTDNKHYYHTYRIIFLYWKAKNIHPKFCINMTIKKYFQQKDPYIPFAIHIRQKHVCSFLVCRRTYTHDQRCKGVLAIGPMRGRLFGYYVFVWSMVVSDT